MRDMQSLADERDLRDERGAESERVGMMTPEEFGKWLGDYDHRWFCDNAEQFAQMEIEDERGEGMTEEVVRYEAERDVKIFQPVMSIDEMVDRYQMMARVTSEIMREGQDYGTIPGTGSKPSLLKPGAEKLATFFGLRKEFAIVEKEQDWTGADHNGEPFFYYLIRCLLYRGNVMVAAADGSCNSWETKYRYRQALQMCPYCGGNAIIKGKEQYGGGWLCFKKKGGCGAKFQDGDNSIEEQPTGRVFNDAIHDQVNTVLKMAEKRALVAGVLLAVGASEFFTQDMEDIIVAEWVEHPPQEPLSRKQPEPDPEPEPETTTGTSGNGRPWDAKTLKTNLLRRGEQVRAQAADSDGGDEWDDVPNPGVTGRLAGLLNGILGDNDRRHTFLEFVFGTPSLKDLDLADVKALEAWLEGRAGLQIITDEANRLVNSIVTEPPPEITTTGTSGNGRPWDAKTLKTNLLRRAGQLREQGDSWLEPPQKGVQGYCTGQLNDILGDDDRRHTFLDYVFGDPSMKKRDRSDVQAMMDWLGGMAGMQVVTDEANRLVNSVVTEQAALSVLRRFDTRDEWEAGQTVHAAIATVKGDPDA